jgi:hypothetical protein
MLFRGHLPHYHWNSIESGATGAGIPDSEYCAPGGAIGWIEYKKSSAWKLDYNLASTQIAWHNRRARAGGRSFIAVRRRHGGGPRKGDAVDELWLFPGTAGALIRQHGLRPEWKDYQALMQLEKLLLGYWANGPAKWDWAVVARCLEGGA